MLKEHKRFTGSVEQTLWGRKNVRKGGTVILLGGLLWEGSHTLRTPTAGGRCDPL